MKCLEEQTPIASPASLPTYPQHNLIFCPWKWFHGPQTRWPFLSSVGWGSPCGNTLGPSPFTLLVQSW